MHVLVPHLILDHLAGGVRTGNFFGVALLVDTSGFTSLTASLMQHGSEGAEALAAVLDAVFAPLVEIVYAHGGFIAGFAGDAFKAVFPVEHPDAYLHAALAALAVRNHIVRHPTRQTRFGLFAFSVKLCLADGDVAWGIWQAESDALQRAAYYFFGSALDACMAADPYCLAGEVVVAPTVYARLHHYQVVAAPLAAYWHLIDAPTLTLSPLASNALPLYEELAAQFFPPELLHRPIRGEFRRVVSVFINLGSLPTDVGFATAFFQLLARSGGYLCRIGQIGPHDPGVTLLLFWGAPVSRDHDVERALQFVLDLRAATHIALRAGVTTNLAYAGFVGGAQREEYTCHSTHVNVAARQMVLAGWGEIWLDAETARVAAGHFELAPHGHHQFKGFAAPQAAFRLLSRRVFSPETFYQYAFVGRRRELAQLQAALAPIFAGRCGGIVTILGEAGIGKSRLVHELRLRYNAPVAPQWFLGQTDELLRRSLNPFRYWLRDYCGQASDAGDAENKRAFTASLDRLVAALRAAPSHVQALGLVVEIERTRSCLGALLDLHWTDSFYARLEPRLRFANTLDALRALILAESLCKPLVLQVEDAHWLDPDSRSLVQRLVEQADEFPFVVVLTARPAAEVSGASGERAAWLGHEADQTQIALEMLTHDDLTVMAEQFLGGPVTDELVRLVHQRAGGNPLFAEQLLLYLSEQGLVEQSGAEWRVSRGAEYATLLPSDARAVLTARIDRLNPMVKAVVQTAAVLGREFAVVLLARMLDDQQELPARLRAAEEAAIWSALDQVRYLFKHALLRDAAYEMQLRVRLRELHRLAAGSIEQLYAHDLVPHYAALAYHTEQAGQTAAAVQWYLLAGEQSSAQYANQDALEAFDRALVLLSHDQSQGRARALLGRVNVYSLLAERAAEQRDLAALQALLDEHDDATLQLNVAVRQLIYFNVVCDYNGARALAPDVVHLAQMVGDVHSEAECYYHWAMAHTGLHDYAAAAACHTAAHALAQQHGHRRIEARALIGLGVISTEQAEYLRAQVYYAEALPIARLLNDTWIEGIILGNSSILMWHLGDVDACERYMLESMRLEQMIGFRRGDAISYKYLALVALARYDLAQARSVSQQALQISRDILDREVEAELLEQLGIICCYESDYDAATSYFEQARAIFHDVGQLVREGLALQNLGAVTQALGQYAVAQRQLEHALALVRSMQNRLFESNVLVSLCVLYYAQGDDAWVVEYGHQAVALGHTVHNRVAIMSALAFQGHALARLNRLDEARVVYQQALASKQEWWGAAAPVLLALTGYLHAVTGMAELALLHKEQVQAKQFAEEVLTYLPDTPLDLRLQPQHILLTCCRVLAALNDFPHIGADCADAGAD